MFLITFLFLNFIFNNISCTDNVAEDSIRNNFPEIQKAFDSINEENAPIALIELLTAEREDK